MNLRELEELEALPFRSNGPNITIHGNQFTENFGDRTLLFGYDTDRRTHHVFLRDGYVVKVVYMGDQDDLVEVTKFTSLADLVPNKRLYPEACDYDFCWFLRSHGVQLNFTKFNANRSVDQFYGRTF